MRKTVIITGASGAIGREIARLFYKKGHNLILLGRSLDKFERFKKDTEEKNRGFIKIVKYDAKEGREDKLLLPLFEEIGPIEILINGAGIGYYESLVDLDDAITKDVFEVNFFAPIRLTKAFLHQKVRPLWIINILSISARLPVPFSGIYASSKSALYMETESARGELPPDVKIINILPGRIESEFSKNAPGTKYFSHGGRRADPKKLANVVYNAFLKGTREVIWPTKYRFILYFQRIFPRVYEEKMRKLKKEYEEKK